MNCWPVFSLCYPVDYSFVYSELMGRKANSVYDSWLLFFGVSGQCETVYRLAE